MRADLNDVNAVQWVDQEQTRGPVHLIPVLTGGGQHFVVGCKQTDTHTHGRIRSGHDKWNVRLLQKLATLSDETQHAVPPSSRLSAFSVPDRREAYTSV